MGTARLSTAEIVNELRSALTRSGWLPAATGPAGPGPLPADAGLADITDALRAHSRVSVLPAAASVELGRATEAAAAAQRLERATDPDSALYGELGAALAYLVQAQGVLRELDAPEASI